MNTNGMTDAEKSTTNTPDIELVDEPHTASEDTPWKKTKIDTCSGIHKQPDFVVR